MSHTNESATLSVERSNTSSTVAVKKQFSKTRIAGVVLSTAGLLSRLSGPNIISDTLHMGTFQHACSESARKQLPKSLVSQVEKERMQNKIPVTGLATRKVSKGRRNGEWQEFATISFDKDFCGFRGDIDIEPLTEQAKNYDESAMRSLDDLSKNEEVISTVKGHKFSEVIDGKEQSLCYSDTIPTSAIVQGKFVVQMTCDRAYPVSEWGDTAPDLTNQIH